MLLCCCWPYPYGTAAGISLSLLNVDANAIIIARPQSTMRIYSFCSICSICSVVLLFPSFRFSAATHLEEERLLSIVTKDNPPHNQEKRDLIRPFFYAWLDKYEKSTLYEQGKVWEERLDIFEANARAVAMHNQAHAAGKTLYVQTVMNSPFADLNDDEFTALYLMESQNCSATATHSHSSNSASVRDL